MFPWKFIASPVALDNSVCSPISIAQLSSLNVKPLDKEPKHTKNKQKELSLGTDALIQTVKNWHNLLAMANFIEKIILYARLINCSFVMIFFSMHFSNVSLQLTALVPSVQDYLEA